MANSQTSKHKMQKSTRSQDLQIQNHCKILIHLSKMIGRTVKKSGKPVEDLNYTISSFK